MSIDTLGYVKRLEAAKFETLLWKHTAAIILAVMAAVGFAMRFGS